MHRFGFDHRYSYNVGIYGVFQLLKNHVNWAVNNLSEAKLGKKLYCQTVYSIICREFASHELIPGAVSLTAQFSYAH